MGLRTMRCDRCGELEQALFRAGPLGHDKVDWYCQECIQATGHWKAEQLSIVAEALKQLNKEHNERSKRRSD